MARLSLADAKEFYAEHSSREFFVPLCEFMSSGPVVALEVVGEGAIGKARELIGPTDSTKAREDAKGSLPGVFAVVSVFVMIGPPVVTETSTSNG